MVPLIHSVGTVAFALSGYLVAVRKKLDLLGIALLATLTAVGGGILRDVLLVRRPLVFASGGPLYASPPVWIAATIGLAWLLRLHRLTDKRAASLFTMCDSMGLVAFAMAGADSGVAAETNLFGTMLLAFVTAVGGGLVRDALVNEVPSVLHEDVYGTIAILVGLVVGALRAAGVAHEPFMPFIFAGGLALRLLVVARGLALPRVR